MKREIKFRAWDKDKKQMFNVTTLFSISEGKAQPWVVDNGMYRPKNFVLEQFTGLHDKGGQEIYESDILRVTTGEDGESYIATVKWFGDEDYPAFDLEGVPAAWNYDANVLATIFQSGVETCEVIGNVHTSPELLEEDK